MDKLFISIGLDKDEIEQSSIRGLLYLGMIFMSGATLAFLIMAILA